MVVLRIGGNIRLSLEISCWKEGVHEELSTRRAVTVKREKKHAYTANIGDQQSRIETLGG